MPINPYNPVLSGMEAAYGLADRIRARAIQQAQLEHMQKADKQREEESQWQRTQDEFKTRLALATAPGLQEVQPGQETRQVDLRIDPSMREAMMGAETFAAQEPIEAPLEYGGKRYAVRSEGEMFDRLMREKEALSGLENVSAGIKARQAFEATAMPVGTIGEPLGMDPGTLVPTASLAGLARAGRPTPTPQPRAPHFSTDDSGNVWQVNPNGSRVNLGKIGKSTRESATGELTANQKVTMARQERERRQALQKEHDALDRQEQAVHTKRRVIGARLRSDENLTPAQRAQLEAEVASLGEQAATLTRQKKEKLAQKSGGSPSTATALPDPLGIR